MSQLMYRNKFLSRPLEVSETHSCYHISSVYERACIVRGLRMRASVRICSGHNSTFILGFQNNLAKLFSQMSSSAIRNICLGSLEALRDFFWCPQGPIFGPFPD